MFTEKNKNVYNVIFALTKKKFQDSKMDIVGGLGGGGGGG